MKPVIEDCYESVLNGTEVQRVVDTNSKNNYRELLNKELENMADQELWKVAKILRELRP